MRASNIGKSYLRTPESDAAWQKHIDELTEAHGQAVAEAFGSGAQCTDVIDHCERELGLRNVDMYSIIAKLLHTGRVRYRPFPGKFRIGEWYYVSPDTNS